MKKEGIDISLKGGTEHVLTPDDSDKVLDARFGKISPEEFKVWYVGLLKSRWATRQQEFIELAKLGMTEEVLLRCPCTGRSPYCYGNTAASFMNALVEQLRKVSTK